MCPSWSGEGDCSGSGRALDDGDATGREIMARRVKRGGWRESDPAVTG